MTLRGARILVAGACTHGGSSLVEAFLALGAHVVAADRLRTQLEELRARTRQHERLWVAESDLGDAQAGVLFADVARDEPIDAALLVLEAGEQAGGAAAFGASTELPAPAVHRCRSFLAAARAAMLPHGRGRALVLLEAGFAEHASAALEALVQDGAAQAFAHGGRELAVGGLIVAGPRGAWLERVIELADPARPPLCGFE